MHQQYTNEAVDFIVRYFRCLTVVPPRPQELLNAQIYQEEAARACYEKRMMVPPACIVSPHPTPSSMSRLFALGNGGDAEKDQKQNRPSGASPEWPLCGDPPIPRPCHVLLPE